MLTLFLGKIHTVNMNSCDMEVTVALAEWHTDYGFWVDAYDEIGNHVSTAPILKRTTVRSRCRKPIDQLTS